MLNLELTPTDVLNIFIVQHRLLSPFDPEAEPNIKLSFDSTITDWREANDLIDWEPLSKYLDDEFRISPTKDEWKATLTPPSKRKLRGVCELISSYYDDNNNCIDKTYSSDSVFELLKDNLKNRNVDISEIKPSSNLSPYLDKYFDEMIIEITILSKGRTAFKQFDIEVKRVKKAKKGLARFFSFFSKVYLYHNFNTGEIKTFKDLTHKIIEVNINI